MAKREPTFLELGGREAELVLLGNIETSFINWQRMGNVRLKPKERVVVQVMISYQNVQEARYLICHVDDNGFLEWNEQSGPGVNPLGVE